MIEGSQRGSENLTMSRFRENTGANIATDVVFDTTAAGHVEVPVGANSSRRRIKFFGDRGLEQTYFESLGSSTVAIQERRRSRSKPAVPIKERPYDTHYIPPGFNVTLAQLDQIHARS